MENENEKKVKLFSSFEDENQYKSERRKKMTVEERLREFAIIQDRRWGSDWRSQPITKKVTIEKTTD
jgi:hypothetical protein